MTPRLVVNDKVVPGMDTRKEPRFVFRAVFPKLYMSEKTKATVLWMVSSNRTIDEALSVRKKLRHFTDAYVKTSAKH